MWPFFKILRPVVIVISVLRLYQTASAIEFGAMSRAHPGYDSSADGRVGAAWYASVPAAQRRLRASTADCRQCLGRRRRQLRDGDERVGGQPPATRPAVSRSAGPYTKAV